MILFGLAYDEQLETRPRHEIARHATIVTGFAALAILSCANAAQAQRIDALVPDEGPPRSLITIKGVALGDTKVIWDAGLPSERILDASEQGALFSVPPGVSVGNHPVALKTAAGRTVATMFRVNGDAPNAIPRLDDIMLIHTRFERGGMVRTELYVQGANVDVGAKVLVDGIEKYSRAQNAITKVDLFGANPAVLGYPIRHYLSRTVELESRPVGSIVSVQLKNEGGEISNIRKYRLPHDAATLDSDGDGIPDIVELNGYDNGNGTVESLQVGHKSTDQFPKSADPFRKDIFVEVDVIKDATIKPEPGTFTEAERMFGNAPIINPFGPPGINLVIKEKEIPELPNFDTIDFFGEADDPQNGRKSFGVLRETNFTRSRWGLYHFATWGKASLEGDSGLSNFSPGWIGAGDRFMITLDTFDDRAHYVRNQAATFVHELGHDLGQRHGGDNDSRFKPNYWSVMSYTWQMRTYMSDVDRKDRPTCAQIYYGVQGQREGDNGELPSSMANPTAQVNLNYSQGMGRTLNGNNNTLNNRLGVCGQQIDWDNSHVFDDQGRNAQIDEDDKPSAFVRDYPNWANLRLYGPGVGYAVMGLGSPVVKTTKDKRMTQIGAGAHLDVSQFDVDSRILHERLKRQLPTEQTSTFEIPPSASSTQERGDKDRLARIQKLVNDLTRTQDLELGTITAKPDSGDSVLLRYDLGKLKDTTIARLPFTERSEIWSGRVDNVIERPVEVEYRNTLTPLGGEQVIAIAGSGQIAANAFRSGNQPISLEVRSANLFAQQIPGEGRALPVNVRVGAQAIQMKEGELAQFGELEVHILRSSNRSAEGPQTEGAPYALDLRIRPVHKN